MADIFQNQVGSGRAMTREALVQGLGAVVSLRVTGGEVAPASLFHTTPPNEVVGYRFTFNLNGVARLTYRVIYEGRSVVTGAAQERPDRPFTVDRPVSPLTIDWRPNEQPQGWYNLFIEGVSFTNQRLLEKLRFYHRTSLQLDSEKSGTSSQAPPAASQSDSRVRTDRERTLRMRTSLSNTQASFVQRVQGLRLYSCINSARNCYVRADLLAPAARARDEAVAIAAKEDFLALSDYMNYSLEPVIRELSLSDVAVTPAQPAATLIAWPRPAMQTEPSYVIEQSSGKRLLSTIAGVLETVLSTTTRIVIPLTFESEPLGAFVEIYAQSRPQEIQSTVTKGTLETVYRGLYRYRASAAGYSIAEGTLDLVNQRPRLVVCTLSESGKSVETSRCVGRQ